MVTELDTGIVDPRSKIKRDELGNGVFEMTRAILCLPQNLMLPAYAVAEVIATKEHGDVSSFYLRELNQKELDYVSYRMDSVHAHYKINHLYGSGCPVQKTRSFLESLLYYLRGQYPKRIKPDDLQSIWTISKAQAMTKIFNLLRATPDFYPLQELPISLSRDNLEKLPDLEIRRVEAAKQLTSILSDERIRLIISATLGEIMYYANNNPGFQNAANQFRNGLGYRPNRFVIENKAYGNECTLLGHVKAVDRNPPGNNIEWDRYRTYYQ